MQSHVTINKLLNVESSTTISLHLMHSRRNGVTTHRLLIYLNDIDSRTISTRGKFADDTNSREAELKLYMTHCVVTKFACDGPVLACRTPVEY